MQKAADIRQPFVFEEQKVVWQRNSSAMKKGEDK